MTKFAFFMAPWAVVTAFTDPLLAAAFAITVVMAVIQ